MFTVGLGSTLTAETLGKRAGKVTGRVFIFRRKTFEKVSEWHKLFKFGCKGHAEYFMVKLGGMGSDGLGT